MTPRTSMGFLPGGPFFCPAAGSATPPPAGPREPSGRSGGVQQHVQQLHRGALVERVVAVAALGCLHTGRAAVVAPAGRDGLPGGAEPAVCGPVAALREPRPTGMAVVDEHRELPVV